MQKPSRISDLMTRKLITCNTGDPLGKARRLMQTHHIRHLPVLDPETQAFVGVVTQKAMLKTAIDIANKFGLANLEMQEDKRTVDSIMETDVKVVDPDFALLPAGEYFLSSKNGALPVVENGKLVGILTSADFVRLSVTLLREADG